MSPRVMPGAEAFALDAGPTGVLLLHGFTGNPASLRPMGEWLHARGHTVRCPRYPGHGTTWRDLARTRWEDWEGEALRALDELRGRCEAVVACGLSVGGAMALHLGARRAEVLRGVVAVNPYVLDRRVAWAPLVRLLLPSVKGVGDDIKKPGRTELPYPRVPLAGLVELARFTRLVRSELSSMRLPLLLFNSPEDHVVPRGNAVLVMRGVGSAEKELVALPDSYHVATLDNDAETIFERTHEFVAARAGAPR